MNISYDDDPKQLTGGEPWKIVDGAVRITLGTNVMILKYQNSRLTIAFPIESAGYAFKKVDSASTQPATYPSTRLQFRLVAPPTDTASPTDEFPDPSDPTRKLHVLKPILLDESAVAAQSYYSTDGAFNTTVNVDFTRDGAATFAAITRAHQRAPRHHLGRQTPNGRILTWHSTSEAKADSATAPGILSQQRQVVVRHFNGISPPRPKANRLFCIEIQKQRRAAALQAAGAEALHYFNHRNLRGFVSFSIPCRFF